MGAGNERRKKKKFSLIWLQRVWIVKVGCMLLKKMIRKVCVKCMLWIGCQKRVQRICNITLQEKIEVNEFVQQTQGVTKLQGSVEILDLR